MHLFRHVLCGVILVALAACRDTLVVENQNEQDRDRALGTAADLENFIGAAYTVAHQGTLGGSNDALQPQLQVMAMENVSGLANFAMNTRSAIARGPIDNTRGSQGNAGNFRDFLVGHRAARQAAIGLARLADLGTLGSPARDARARAFARFAQGVALGNLALAYDSASILTENDDPTAPSVALSSYTVVMAAALAYLDSAIAIASQPTPSGPAADWFPLPNTWINGQALTVAQFVQFARSYKARFSAGVARTPAERAAVDWTAVIADAAAGITADFNVTLNPTAGWDVSWVVQHYATGSANWHQVSQFWLGMADSSGGYNAWLATPRAGRIPFLVVTADRRFPQGTTRGAQSAVVVPGNFTTIPYFRNRPSGEDQPGDPLQISMYDYYRSRAAFLAARVNVPYPIMTAAEIRLLAAEGYVRTGNIAQAAALIDFTRAAPTRGSLPSLVTAGITDTLTAVPGGAGCVPRVPDAAASYTSSKCGNLWDALKWEYRMETAYAGYGMWFFASRGWGDLPEGTAIHWPVPYQEMDTRQQAFYGLGGVGAPGGAGPGNYGLFAGGVY